jgi:hypothetical protein
MTHQDTIKKVGSVENEHIEEANGGDHNRIDPEVAKYMSTTAIEIDEATNKRLKRLIDTRVLTVMVVTYFLQALDKGTLSFSSIMHLPEDTNLEGQQVRCLKKL